jgi:hypothetical protein
VKVEVMVNLENDPHWSMNQEAYLIFAERSEKEMRLLFEEAQPVFDNEMVQVQVNQLILISFSVVHFDNLQR